MGALFRRPRKTLYEPLCTNPNCSLHKPEALEVNRALSLLEVQNHPAASQALRILPRTLLVSRRRRTTTHHAGLRPHLPPILFLRRVHSSSKTHRARTVQRFSSIVSEYLDSTAIGSPATPAKRAVLFTVEVTLRHTRQPDPVAARALERCV